MTSAKKNDLVQRLQPFVPDGTAEEIVTLIAQYKVRFRISKPRQSKLGDYRHPGKTGGHRISVNGDLNAYSFYITTLHEFAHLIAFEQFGSRIAPHGAEWKQIFGQLLHQSLQNGIFPAKVGRELQRYLKSPSASSCADHGLSKALREYDANPTTLLEELPENTCFSLNGRRLFLKGPKLRKRYRCQDVQNKRMYLISAIAEVQLVETSH